MKLENLLTEETLCGALDMNSKQLYELRRKGLPYIPLSRNRRVYDDESVYSFLKEKETSLSNPSVIRGESMRFKKVLVR